MDPIFSDVNKANATASISTTPKSGAQTSVAYNAPGERLAPYQKLDGSAGGYRAMAGFGPSQLIPYLITLTNAGAAAVSATVGDAVGIIAGAVTGTKVWNELPSAYPGTFTVGGNNGTNSLYYINADIASGGAYVIAGVLVDAGTTLNTYTFKGAAIDSTTTGSKVVNPQSAKRANQFDPNIQLFGGNYDVLDRYSAYTFVTSAGDNLSVTLFLGGIADVHNMRPLPGVVMN